MPSILPSGKYYDAPYPVADASVECAVRPTGKVLTDNWQDDPMNAAVCWRDKTPAEVAAEVQVEEDAMLFPDVLKVLAKALHNHENRIRALEGKNPITLRQVIKALRNL